MVEEQQIPLITLIIEIHSSNKIILLRADKRDVEVLLYPRFDDSHGFILVVIDLDGLGVVPEEEAIVTCEPNEWIAALEVVVGHCGFLVDGHWLEGLEAVDEGFALVGVDFIEHLQVLLRGGESHRVDVVAVFLEQQGFLEQAIHDELGL